MMAKLQHLFGLRAIYGSSHNGGISVLREGIRVLRRGDHSLCISPDGPGGPSLRVQEGALYFAKMTGAPIIPVCFSAKHVWIQNRWDRYLLVYPFTKIKCRVGEPIYIDSKIEPNTIILWATYTNKYKMVTPWWFLHKTPLAFLLLPIAWIYYLASRMVFNWRRMVAYKSRRKVICIGGLLAGGVGKTPIVRVIANYLDAPVVMRGYRRTASTANIGDEAAMLMSDDIAVHVGHRKSNIMLLDRQQDEKGPILMDDGLQNPLIKKDISILVFDEMIGFGNGFLLPAGPLREPKCHAKNADAIIIIKNPRAKRKLKLPDTVPVFYAENKTILRLRV